MDVQEMAVCQDFSHRGVGIDPFENMLVEQQPQLTIRRDIRGFVFRACCCGRKESAFSWQYFCWTSGFSPLSGPSVTIPLFGFTTPDLSVWL